MFQIRVTCDRCETKFHTLSTHYARNAGETLSEMGWVIQSIDKQNKPDLCPDCVSDLKAIIQRAAKRRRTMP